MKHIDKHFNVRSAKTVANFTKLAIKKAFLELLSQRPYSEITVKDIVCQCGINRNSFYYHYQDMAALVEEIAKESCDSIIENYPTPASFEECLNAAMDFVYENKRAVYHIYKSVDRALFEKYLWKICDYAVHKYLNTAFPKENIDERDKRILLQHFRCQCFGQIMDWMERGMPEEVRENIPYLCEIYHCLTEDFLSRVRQK